MQDTLNEGVLHDISEINIVFFEGPSYNPTLKCFNNLCNDRGDPLHNRYKDLAKNPRNNLWSCCGYCLLVYYH